MPLFRFPLNRGKAFMQHYAASSEKSLVCLRCSVVNALATLRLHYQLFSVKRSSLRSERKRSKLLFEFNGKLRASYRRRKCRSYAFRLMAKRLLYGITPPLPKKSPSALTREKLSLCSVFHGSLDYRFFSVKGFEIKNTPQGVKIIIY